MGREDRGTRAVRRRDAVRGHSGAGAGACPAGAARHARRDPGRRRAAGSRCVARASCGIGRDRRDGLCAGLARQRPAHRRTAQRHRRARDRAVRGAAVRLGSGGDAGSAGGPRGRRAAGSSGSEMLAAFILGYDVVGRLAGGFTPRPLAHQNGQVSLLAAAVAGADCAGSTPPESAGRCASRRRCC